MSFAVDFELMEIAIPSAHCRLDVFLEFVERAIPDLYSSPDWRIGSE